MNNLDTDLRNIWIDENFNATLTRKGQLLPDNDDVILAVKGKKIESNDINGINIVKKICCVFVDVNCEYTNEDIINHIHEITGHNIPEIDIYKRNKNQMEGYLYAIRLYKKNINVNLSPSSMYASDAFQRDGFCNLKLKDIGTIIKDYNDGTYLV